MSEQILVPKHFQGPTDIVNGGYLSGLLGERLGSCAEVSLRAPWPVDKVLTLDQDRAGITVHDDGRQIAAARPAVPFQMDVPAVPEMAEVISAETDYRENGGSPVPNCFVCGVNREPGKGLRVFAGRIPGRNLAASRWTPGQELADENNLVADRYIWGALDCPSAWALPAGFGDNTLLAKMEAETFMPLQAGTKCTVLAWQLGAVDGRKATSASALINETGQVVAHTRTLWVRVEKVS